MDRGLLEIGRVRPLALDARAPIGRTVVPAADDAIAYRRNPELRWVYHKPLLYDALGVPHGLFPDLPKAYPAIMKPIVNLYGLSRGVRLAHGPDDIAQCPERFWMPRLAGRHVSVDIEICADALLHGEAVEGISYQLGLFDYWERLESADPWASWAHRIARTLGITGGALNVEFIGNTAIEVHLRRSDEFTVLFAEGLRYAKPLISPRCLPMTDETLASRLGGRRFKSCVSGDDRPEMTAPGWYRYGLAYGDSLSELQQLKVV